MKQVKIFATSVSGRSILESQINSFIAEHPGEVENILYGACGGDNHETLSAMIIYNVPEAE